MFILQKMVVQKVTIPGKALKVDENDSGAGTPAVVSKVRDCSSGLAGGLSPKSMGLGRGGSGGISGPDSSLSSPSSS